MQCEMYFVCAEPAPASGWKTRYKVSMNFDGAIQKSVCKKHTQLPCQHFPSVLSVYFRPLMGKSRRK